MKNYHTLLGTVIFLIIAVAVIMDVSTLSRLKHLEMRQSELSRSTRFLCDYVQAVDKQCKTTHAKYTQLDLDTLEQWLRQNRPMFLYGLYDSGTTIQQINNRKARK